MNLLNGLAVSDIREILEEAEMLSLQSRVDQICYAESIVLRDYRGCGKVLRRLFGMITGSKGIFMFPNPRSERIKVVKPNMPESRCRILCRRQQVWLQ